MKWPKILMFTPIYDAKDYCMDMFLEHANAVNYPNKRHIFIDNSATTEYYDKLKGMGLDVFHIERGNNSREALARAQNFARNIAIEEGYDYMFSLESDIMIPPNMLQLLLRHGKDVISGLYLIGDRKAEFMMPCITLREWNQALGAWGTRLLIPDEFNDYLHKGVKRVQAAGMGCCLIYKRAFNLTAFTYDSRFTSHSDVYFFNRMFEKKIPVYVDTDIFCDHQCSNWLEVKDR